MNKLKKNFLLHCGGFGVRTRLHNYETFYQDCRKMKLAIFNVFLSILILSVNVLSVPLSNGYKLDVVKSDPSSMIIEIFFDSINLVQKQINADWYTQISFPKCAYTEQNGLPRLPMTSVVVGIPPQGEIGINILNLVQSTRHVPDIEIAKNEFIQEDKNSIQEIESDNMIPVTKGWYPSNLVDIGKVGFVRDQRIAQIEIHPVQYDIKTQMIKITTKLQIRLSFNLEGAEQTYPSLTKNKKERPDFESYLSNHLLNYDQALAWRQPPTHSVQVLNVSSTNQEHQFKLMIENDGIYYVTGRDLQKAGANLSEIDIRTLKLMNKGKIVPLCIEGEGNGIFDEDDRIIFIGEFNRGENTYFSPYTLKNVYWLSWGGTPGLRFAEVSGYPSSIDLDRADAMRSLIHLEKDDEYRRLMRIPEEEVDHWFWRQLAMGGENQFELPVIEPVDKGFAALRISLRGLTYMTAIPDHHITVTLNGQEVADMIFDNQEEVLIENTQIPNSLLSRDKNILNFEFPGDLGVENDIVLLNWIEFEYNRVFVTSKDTLCFQYPDYHLGTKKLTTIWGLSEPDVYIFDSSGRRLIDFMVNKGEDSYAITFSNLAVSNEVYYVAGASRLKPVQKIEKYIPAQLKSPNNGADYIIITHADFKDQAHKLAEFRQAQGLRVIVVDVRSVYDEFSHGIYDPRAIQNFLKYAYDNWQRPAPVYVLLIGDTTHNFDKLVWDEKNKHRTKYPTFVPTMMVYTSSWGMCSSDNYFACVSGDDFLPDMFIGRLPANTHDEANIMVEKIIAYESKSEPGDWRNHICLAAGDGDFFEYSTQYLYDNYVPNRVNVSRISTNYGSPYFGSTSKLVNIINEGASILDFSGHGGGAVYFDSELFTLDDVNQLANTNKYPIAFSLTCYVGYFDNPEAPSLGESLLLSPHRGIVGHFGSAGRAYLYGGFYLNNALFDEIFAKNTKVLGEVTTFAKLEMLQQAQAYWDHVANYNLLGDPATRIIIPDENIQLSLEQTSLAAGDVLSVNGKVKNVQNGDLILSVYNEQDSLITSEQVQFSNGSFSKKVFVLREPYLSAWDDMGGKGFVRAYYSDGDKDAVGGTSFYILKPAIDNVEVIPAEPVHNQDVYFSARVEASSLLEDHKVGRVICLWSLDKANWDTLAMSAGSANIYRTIIPIRQDESFEVFYMIQARNLTDDIVLSETPVYSFKVKTRSNLFCRPDYIHIGGIDEVNLNIRISNLGESDSGPFKIKVFDLGTSSEGEEIAAPLNIENLKANTDTLVDFPWQGNPVGYKKIKVQLDAENQVDEASEQDNCLSLELYLITTRNGSNGSLVSKDGNAVIEVPSKGVNKNISSSWQAITDKSFDSAILESNLHKGQYANSGRWQVYTLTSVDSTIQFTKPVKITFYYNGSEDFTKKAVEMKQLKIFGWNPELRNWTGLETELNQQNGCAFTQVKSSMNTFALLASEDIEPPVITMNVEGQHFVEGDYVSRNPSMTFVIEDSSAVDMNLHPIVMTLDDNDVEGVQYTVFQSTPKRVTCTFNPILDIGDHNLVLNASDINGNIASYEVNCSVAGDFSLVSIANHPNPFADETYIAFNLSEPAESIELDIYTSSGRCIRSFDLADVGGYEEILWDGVDAEGDEVANGVYYLKFCARKGEKKIERIEKMAKLK